MSAEVHIHEDKNGHAISVVLVDHNTAEIVELDNVVAVEKQWNKRAQNVVLTLRARLIVHQERLS